MRCTSPSAKFFPTFSFSFFTTTTFFLGVLFFGMGTDLGIYYKSKSPSTCENWCFNPPLFAPPSDSPPFCAFGRAENVLFLATQFVRIHKTNCVDSRTGKIGGAFVLSTMFRFIAFLPFSQNLSNKGKKKVGKKRQKLKKWATLDCFLHFGSLNH